MTNKNNKSGNNKTKNNKKKAKEKFSFLQWIDKVTTKHWFFTSIFIVGASSWFSLFIPFYGEQWNLIYIDKNGVKNFTFWGFLFTILVIVITLINTALSKYRKDLPNETQKELIKTKKDLNNTIVGFNLLDKLLSNISKVCDSKFSRQTKKIESIKQNNEEPPIIYSNPCDQFETILNEIVDCLAFVLSANGHKIKNNLLYASIAYNFPEENKGTWHWVNVQDQKGLDLESLLKDGTTFSYLLNSTKTFVFYNSKQNALDDKKYVPDNYDEYDHKGDLSGSIFCYEITIKKQDIIYIRAILSITSYGIKFVNVENAKDENQENIINTKENIRHIILSEFEKRIKIELCNYYIQFLRSKWEEENQVNS